MKLTFLSTAAIAAGLLAGCAASPATTKAGASASAESSATSIEARAQKRWDLLVAGKAAQAYDYLSPGYRQLKKREDYASEMAVRPVQWSKAEVKGSECPSPDEICDVTIEVSYSIESTLPGVGKIESVSPVAERWIMTEGNWYFVPKEVARN